MAMLLVRIGLGLGLVLLAVQWPAPVLIGVWVLVIWLVPRAYCDQQQIARLRRANPVESLLVAELRSELRIAHAHIEFLQEQLEEVSQAPSSPSTSGHPLYRRVGLDQDCPRWVAEVVRHEYRRQLHPDGKPAGQKVEAERRFKEMEAVFGEIWKLRGF
jgi:hypothetical protein